MVLCALCVSGCKSALTQKELLDRAVVSRDIAAVSQFAEEGDIDAIKALGQFTDNPEAVGYLTKILENGNPYSQKIAAQSLIYHLDNEDARVAIAEHLQNAQTPIRFGILQGLERTQSVDKATRAAFIKIALNDLNPSMRMEAAITLRQIGDYSAGDIVYDLLSEEYVVVRRKAVQEIQHYSSAKYTPWLKALLNDADGTVRKYAAIALENMPEGSVVESFASKPDTPVVVAAPVKRTGNSQVGVDELMREVRAIVPGRVKKTNFLFVVGVGDYEELPDIPYSRQSAMVFADAIKRKMGVPDENVYALYDRQATGTRIYSRLSNMLNRLNDNSVVYFYYSGHGIPSKDGESSYLLPVDSSMGVFEDERMELHNLLSMIGKKHPKRIVAVIDSCFSGKISVDQLLYEGIAPAVIVQPKIHTLDSDVTLVLAAREDEFSNSYKEKRHRLFSYYFVKALCANKTTFSEIADYVRNGVVSKSSQLGRSYTQHPQFRGDLDGQF